MARPLQEIVFLEGTDVDYTTPSDLIALALQSWHKKGEKTKICIRKDSYRGWNYGLKVIFTDWPYTIRDTNEMIEYFRKLGWQVTVSRWVTEPITILIFEWNHPTTPLTQAVPLSA